MILHSLTMKNFGPYKIEQTVAFPHAASANLVVIYGENMRGKTSFLNAIRWCLYGEAIGRGRRLLPFAEITNYDARERGDYLTVVALVFSHDEMMWRLTRSINRAPLVADPRKNEDYATTLALERNGHHIASERIPEEINRILPHEVSRFFLFDGELLGEYEELVTADSRRALGIMTSIENILGVPALIRTRDELVPLV